MAEQCRPEMVTLTYETVSASVASLLDRERTARTPIEIHRAVAGLLERQLARLDYLLAPACRAGCAWCCYVSVACSPPEAIAVADFVRSNLSKRARRQLSTRIEYFREHTRGLDSSERAILRVPCPFLAENRCLVHPARPLACRGWHSFDVEQCKQNWKDPSSLVDASGMRLAIRGAASSGLRDALRRGNLVTDSVELVGAVHLALKAEGEVVAWQEGQPAFGAVRWRDRPAP